MDIFLYFSSNTDQILNPENTASVKWINLFAHIRRCYWWSRATTSSASSGRDTQDQCIEWNGCFIVQRHHSRALYPGVPWFCSIWVPACPAVAPTAQTAPPSGSPASRPWLSESIPLCAPSLRSRRLYHTLKQSERRLTDWPHSECPLCRNDNTAPGL